jgi:NADH:ubiquinone oxidoreductase subunit F (NADH-binding)
MITMPPEAEPAGPPIRIPPPGRLLAAAAADWAEHQRRSGPKPVVPAGPAGRRWLFDLVEAAGLTGRGGAAFPAWRKLAALGADPIVIANGAEGEPASGKDATLIRLAPHLVLDGLGLVAESVGARRAYAYVPAGPGAARLRAALAERGGETVPVEVVEAPDTFLAGEETAVAARVAGRPALPRDKAVRLVEAGVRGRPTLVHNVETLAHAAQIARYGPAWFRRLGTPAEPGTFLATVSGAVGRPGVYEAAFGTTLAELVAGAGGPSEPARAYLVGGYHGRWVDASAGDHLALTPAMRPSGVAVGAGVVIAVGMPACGLAETARILAYLADQSAGTCGPCRMGMPALAAAFERLATAGRQPLDVAALDVAAPDAVTTLADLVEGRGACRNPDGAARLARSALNTFADDVALHLTGRCLASGHTDRGSVAR